MGWTLGLSLLMGGTEAYLAAHLSAGRPRLGSYWSIRPPACAHPARQKSPPVCLGTLGQGRERCWAGPAGCRCPGPRPLRVDGGGGGRSVPGWEPRGVFCNHNMISCAEPRSRQGEAGGGRPGSGGSGFPPALAPPRTALEFSPCPPLPCTHL